MFKLGLTGSIATGKSTALKAFADLGIPVFSPTTSCTCSIGTRRSGPILPGGIATC